MHQLTCVKRFCMLRVLVWIFWKFKFWTPIKSRNARFLCKLHGLTAQNIVETICGRSLYSSKFKHRPIGFILTNMENDLEHYFGNGFLPNLSSPMQMVSNQKLQCERSLKDQAPWTYIYVLLVEIATISEKRATSLSGHEQSPDQNQSRGIFLACSKMCKMSRTYFAWLYDSQTTSSGRSYVIEGNRCTFQSYDQ